MGQDDEFDFSDDDLDDLPANTLQQLETTAIRATQHFPPTALESEYGLDDGDEVINLNDAAPPQPSPWVNVPRHQPNHPYPQHDSRNDANGNSFYNDAMEIEEQPRRSQIDSNQLLLRIKKVFPPRSPFQGSADLSSWSKTRPA